MGFVSGVTRLVVGAIFGLGFYILLTPIFAALIDTGNSTVITGLMLAVVLLSALAAVLTSTIRRAFGFGFLWLGLASLALPLSTMVLAGRVGSQLIDQADAGSRSASLVGAGIGGMMLTGASAFIGFFLGAIFLVLALVLLLNSKRQVIFVDRATGRAAIGDFAEIDTSKWSRKDRKALQRQRGQIEPPMN